MTNQEAREILKYAFPDQKIPDGRWLDNHPEDFDRDPTKHLRQYPDSQDDEGWYICADADTGYARFGNFDYDADTLEALAMWMRDPVAVVNAK